MTRPRSGPPPYNPLCDLHDPLAQNLGGRDPHNSTRIDAYANGTRPTLIEISSNYFIK